MPRKAIIRSKKHFYHITARSNHNDNFYISKERLWIHFNLHLRKLQTEFSIKIGAFVLMDNHFHLLLLSPQEDIDKIMFLLMSKMSYQIRKESMRINRIFAGHYKGCLLEREEYVRNVYKYIYRYPVEAGLCRKIEDYPYSSWKSSIVVIEKLLLNEKFSDIELKWLNLGFEKVHFEGIQRSLKRTYFHVSRKWILPSDYPPKV